MAWDEAAKKLAIKVIGTVESNLKYDAINYNDPITVGIMQWYATRAANLLNQIRGTSAWTGVTQRVDDALATQPTTNASFWTNFELTRQDGQSLQAVLVTDIGVQVQNAQTIADFEDYRIAAERLGINAETNTDAFIYFCMLYHQSPRYSQRVLKAAGANPSMARLHSIALNDAWYSRYKTRINTARNIILSGDSSGVPDFGVPLTPDPETGGDIGTMPTPTDELPPGSRLLGDISSINKVGEQLHIYTKDGIVVAQPTSTGLTWIVGGLDQPTTGPVVPPATPLPPTESTDPLPTPNPNDPLAAKVVFWMTSREKKFYYSQNAGRDDPDKTGYGDCSSAVRRAYRDVANIEIGTYTVDQQNYGTVVWSNHPGNRFGASKGQKPPLSVLQPADLIFTRSSSTFGRVTHVEMWVGNGDNRSIGHGGPRWENKGPVYKTYAWFDKFPWIIVRRHLNV